MPVATIKMSRRAVVVQRAGRRRTAMFVSNEVRNEHHSVVRLKVMTFANDSTNQKTNKP